MTVFNWKSAVSGSFTDPTKWDVDAVPADADTVRITTAGSYMITSSGDRNIRNLLLGAQAELDVASGTFAVALDGSGTDAISIGATSSLTVSSGATLKVG